MPGVVAEYVRREDDEEREFWRRYDENVAHFSLVNAIRREIYKEPERYEDLGLSRNAAYHHAYLWAEGKALERVAEMCEQNPGACYQHLLAQYKAQKRRD
jgi:hypothetical protein